MPEVKVFGEFPPVLYRSFSKEQYAREFVDEGKLRIRPLEYYRYIEDNERRDATEGNGQCHYSGEVERVALDENGDVLRVEPTAGEIHLTTSISNIVFIYCCSFPPEGNIDKLPGHFGDHTVEISDPLQFFHDMAEASSQFSELMVANVEVGEVVYDKGKVLDRKPTTEETFGMSIFQKPSQFSVEHEFRIAIMTGLVEYDRDGFIDLNIGRSLEYATLI
jgi:hypothetical protein